MRVLIFPSCIAASVEFLKEARRWKCFVIGSSSLETDPTAGLYDEWVQLPNINNRLFGEKLLQLVKNKNITRIYTPHASTYRLLNSELKPYLKNVEIHGEGPFYTEMSKINDAIKVANATLSDLDNFGLGSTSLDKSFLASLLYKMETIHGECSREKALALCAIFGNTPKGDVVEIGSLFGKSTYLLNRLAGHFQIGATLAIDPWEVDESIQFDAPKIIQNASRDWDWEVVFQGFLINLLGTYHPGFNYIRSTSENAYESYEQGCLIKSQEFGKTEYAGKISILHLDGNHDEAAIQKDFELWSRHLIPGGWIIFDDYDWIFGNGPKIVGDQVIEKYENRIEAYFTKGGALFINFIA